MKNKYYIVYGPELYNLMGSLGKCQTPLDLISYLANRDANQLNEKTYLTYLQYDPKKRKRGFNNAFACENYAISYIANQLAIHEKNSTIILCDGERRSIHDIILKNGKPAGVFISSMSSTFPTAVCTSIILNFAKIPVIIGGIHVSSSPKDMDLFIRQYVPHPGLVSQVRGAGDSDTISSLLRDLNSNNLQTEYAGTKVLENGIWGQNNIDTMPPLKLDTFDRIPLLGKWLKNKIKIYSIAPLMGCPYSCNFCSIYSVPKQQRKLAIRSPEDFVNEIKNHQKDGGDLKYTSFQFSTDNMLVGGKKIESILDKIIENRLPVKYSAMISIDVARNKNLLRKLRLSGATHFNLGLESLDIRNLRFLGKNVVKDIEKSGLTVKQYYAQEIKKIQDYGISVHGSFILGLPYDYFNSIHDNSGIEIADFCSENNIAVQSAALSDLPGSKNFSESQKNSTLCG